MLIATKPKHRTLNNAAEKLHLKIRGSELEDVVSKYLGVHVDDSLIGNFHLILSFLYMILHQLKKYVTNIKMNVYLIILFFQEVMFQGVFDVLLAQK